MSTSPSGAVLSTDPVSMMGLSLDRSALPPRCVYDFQGLGHAVLHYSAFLLSRSVAKSIRSLGVVVTNMNSGHIFVLSGSVIFISLYINSFIIVCQDCLTR